MSKKCRVYSESKLGLANADNRKAFYAGWDAALRERLAQPEQPAQHECPVAVYRSGRVTENGLHIEFWKDMDDDEVLLYTSPPPRKPWVGLTEDDIEYPYPPAKPPVYATAMNTKAVRDGFELGGYEKKAGYYSEAQLDEFARTIEAKLKEKNT